MSGGEAQATSRSAQDRRYWLSMAAVAGLTLLVAGLAGGTVTLLTSDPGTASAWGAATVALIGGALGAGIEDYDDVRDAAYSRGSEAAAVLDATEQG